MNVCSLGVDREVNCVLRKVNPNLLRKVCYDQKSNLYPLENLILSGYEQKSPFKQYLKNLLTFYSGT